MLQRLNVNIVSDNKSSGSSTTSLTVNAYSAGSSTTKSVFLFKKYETTAKARAARIKTMINTFFMGFVLVNFDLPRYRGLK
jgi:hypothetical protein